MCLPSGLLDILRDPNSTRWDDSYIPKILPTPSIWKFGLLPAEPSQEESASLVLDALGTNLATLPMAIDHSLALPPVGDQGDSNSCVAWAVGYYMKSFQESREWGWSLDESVHQFSPAFIYNQLQYYDEGSRFEKTFDVLVEQGCATLEMMPYDDNNHLAWPSADVYREAIPFRALSYDYLGHGETEDDDWHLQSTKGSWHGGDCCRMLSTAPVWMREILWMTRGMSQRHMVVGSIWGLTAGLIRRQSTLIEDGVLTKP